MKKPAAPGLKGTKSTPSAVMPSTTGTISRPLTQ
jgi:hypothetical protein